MRRDKCRTGKQDRIDRRYQWRNEKQKGNRKVVLMTIKEQNKIKKNNDEIRKDETIPDQTIKDQKRR